MIIVRDVFQAKYGKGGELVALFKEGKQKFSQLFGNSRILTDASGQFFTIVTEREYSNLGEWDRQRSQIFAHPEFPNWFNRMVPLVESGRREFYNVEG